MKRYVYLVMFALLISSSVFGQGAHFHTDSTQKCLTFDWKPFEVGVETGPTLTTFWTNSSLTYGQDLHYTAGLFFRYNVNYWVGFQSGINIERVGYRNNFKWTDVLGNPIGDAYVKVQNDYLTFPVLVRFSAIEKRMSFNFTVGGFFSYLFYSKDILAPLPPGTPGDPNPGQETITDRTDQFRRFNGGISAGIGLDYKFKFGLNIGLEVRNQLGLYHIPNNDPASNTNIRTNSLQCLLRLSWKFGMDTRSRICGKMSSRSSRITRVISR